MPISEPLTGFRSEYVLDFSRLEVFECGALLLTLLALPELPEPEADAEDRGGILASLCHLHLASLYCGKPDEQVAQPMKPLYAFRDTRAVEKDRRLLERRLSERIAAADTVIPFLQEVELGHVPVLPPGVERLSLNQMSAFMSEISGRSDPDNFETRVVRPSLPVVHIAAAIQVTHADMVRVGGRGLGWADFMEYRDLLEIVVQRAEHYAELLLRGTRISVAPDRLIRLRLAG